MPLLEALRYTCTMRAASSEVEVWLSAEPFCCCNSLSALGFLIACHILLPITVHKRSCRLLLFAEFWKTDIIQCKMPRVPG